MRKLALAAALSFQIPARDLQAQTAQEVVTRIEQQSGVPAREGTVDTFKAGSPSTRVTGVAVTMMATLDVLQRAAAKGHNLVITHEPTFYSHRDLTEPLEKESDAVLAAKKKFISDHGLVVWRFHDRPHLMKPDKIAAGTVEKLRWQRFQDAKNPSIFNLPATTMESLARFLESRLGAGAIRFVGDRKAKVSRVGMTFGFPGFAANRGVLQWAGIDVLVMGEDHEWETIAYASDAISAGLLKGVIVVGHTPSEQAGMEAVAAWLSTFLSGIRVEFIPAKDPFVGRR
jgi:putative NIF3 family GTP cyclohydrolase 1 type 2